MEGGKVELFDGVMERIERVFLTARWREDKLRSVGALEDRFQSFGCASM